MLQPLGFEVNGKEDKVFRLRKALYDLKQAPRAWNKRLDSFLLQLGFVKCFVEHGIYVKAKIDVDCIIKMDWFSYNQQSQVNQFPISCGLLYSI